MSDEIASAGHRIFTRQSYTGAKRHGKGIIDTLKECFIQTFCGLPFRRAVFCIAFKISKRKYTNRAYML